jgi:hypothetical protein
VHCALGLSPRQGTACSAKRPSYLGWWPISARQGRRSATTALVTAQLDSGGARRRGVAGRVRGARRQGGGPILGWQEGRAHQKNELNGKVWSAGGERRWGWHPGLVVDGSGCTEVVHDGAVLGAWSKRSERGRSRLSMVARRLTEPPGAHSTAVQRRAQEPTERTRNREIDTLEHRGKSN